VVSAKPIKITENSTNLQKNDQGSRLIEMEPDLRRHIIALLELMIRYNGQAGLTEARLFEAERNLNLSRDKIREAIKHLEARGAAKLIQSTTRPYGFTQSFVTEAGKLYYHQLIGQEPKQRIKISSPVEIQESLKRFKKDFPDSSRVGFIMMKFENTPTHKNILKTVKEVLGSYGLKGIRSDDKEYHSDLFHNIETCMHGCGFGIAIFDRIEGEEFSPNVSLEVGYMMALQKPICLLKDKNLGTLHADLLGKLYREFDPQKPERKVRYELSKWLCDKGLGVAKKSIPAFRWRTVITEPIKLSQIKKQALWFQRIPSKPADPLQIGVDVLLPRSIRRKYGGEKYSFSHFKYEFEAGKHRIYLNFKKLAKLLIKLGAKNEDAFRFEIRYPK